jgi:SAM-dependent methyltransferase
MAERKESPHPFIDPGEPAEWARLRIREGLLTEAMGGLLANLNPAGIQRVLEIACGPGSWVHNLAFTYPDMEVIGIDASEQMIEYARQRAYAQRLANASFQVMDATQPLLFPDESFDLVHARTLCTIIPAKNWPLLLLEIKRILKPGGTFFWSEFDRAWTNSSAHERMSDLITQAMYRLGMGFSANGSHVGLLPKLVPLLTEAGFLNIQTRMYGLDYSSGLEAHKQWSKDLEIMLLLTGTYIEKAGVATREEIEHIYNQTVIEMNAPDFCGLTPYRIAWAQTPVGP